MFTSADIKRHDLGDWLKEHKHESFDFDTKDCPGGAFLQRRHGIEFARNGFGGYAMGYRESTIVGGRVFGYPSWFAAWIEAMHKKLGYSLKKRTITGETALEVLNGIAY